MAILHQKRKLKNFLHSKWVLGVLVLLCVPLLFSVHERWVVEREMAARLQETQQERQTLLERKDSLEQRVEYLKDERGIEAEIRRNFDIAKEGEQVIIILEDEARAEQDVVTSSPEIEDESPWYLFWR